jgi:hypothetical protein
MKKRTIIARTLIFQIVTLFFLTTVSDGMGKSGSSSESDPQAKLANCLTEKGWALYSSLTCSACRSQQKAFGKAFILIQTIECHPHAKNSQVELCMQKGIEKTPTWILEQKGRELKRLVGYHRLRELGEISECEY